MKKIVLFIALLSLCTASILASNPFQVEFQVTDTLGNLLPEFQIHLVHSQSGEIYQTKDKYLKMRSKGLYKLSLFSPGYKSQHIQLNLSRDTILKLSMQVDILTQNAYVVRAIVTEKKSAVASSELSRRDITPYNMGADFTYLMGNTVSAVTTSDAGAGVGYTGIRIRGSDASRINVTVNGVPINDAESHGVFWVNMPDLASSATQVQIQRGVGASTIGTGSFGANINVMNFESSKLPYLNLQQSAGSFHTFKSTMRFGTGDMKGLNFSGRLSKISSDGYIDRAFSDLKSYQFNLNYEYKKWLFQAIAFGGTEKTYQSWYGTPESRVKGNVNEMNAYADRNYLSEEERKNLLESGRTYNYYTYDNQTDNYGQYHYQLHVNKRIKNRLFLKSTLFLTKGAGYYEEFRKDAEFASYRVPDYDSTTTTTDLVRQRWLDNAFYGQLTSFVYYNPKFILKGGLSTTIYEGEHFGEVVWADIAKPFGKGNRYYESNSEKIASNGFLKISKKINKKWTLDADMQLRSVQYMSKGDDNDGTAINFDRNFTFFNPKAGIMREINKRSYLSAGVSVGQREPVRTDFIDNPVGTVPTHEKMTDFELGYYYTGKKIAYMANLYHMQYKNQLVLTGEINDVGSPLRRNVSNSFRQGLELAAEWKVNEKLTLNANMTLSRNRIMEYNDFYFDYDSGKQLFKHYKNTSIAFSPDIVAFAGICYKPLPQSEFRLNAKHVGKQYLDNTADDAHAIDAYTVLDVNVLQQFPIGKTSTLAVKGMISNILGIFYSNNGYTFKYAASGNLISENFYYPQSGRIFQFGIEFNFL